ncbi:dimethyladenosine transferase [Hathewaya proteolytica DSM 3090]|uniref:Ribosomal RNA small subunit methyltransferase A n=1 Tax=Hathewaya proteolytica DSM 3090 TaxID=1121331 RepID=A0A1M6RL32_9CLOT|nr:16S rRNA (adenine(1518)-N(6)/adenine(1519)-N(6))-dimethyltransferase RsmA [Hathewaya proteolytica]SHK33139.1 dimethyladenosine transferase [Hathewaya proteolytica DSM 3090]
MEKLTTREVVARNEFKFSKALGQNFLTDEKVLKDIVDAGEISENDLVIEIGPGVGTLTRELLKKAKKVIAIELDERLINILKEELSDFPNFQLIHMDALKVDFNSLIGEETSVKIVANLPYYVTTPIITRLLNERYNFKSLTIMIQKEVAERIAADANSKEYGALSLLVQYHCNAKIVRHVSPNCFLPRPKVDSIVIKLDKLDKPRVKVEKEDLFFKVIRAAFNMRRKTLWNALKPMGLPKERMEKAFELSNIDPSRRGETLSIEEFASLSDNILKQSVDF